MKLYTEEQLFNTVNAVRYYEETYDEKIAEERIEKHLKALEPIELPSDEEIENGARNYYENDLNPSYKTTTFVWACKWYREQLKSRQ